jgi:hypothetical protein
MRVSDTGCLPCCRRSQQWLHLPQHFSPRSDLVSAACGSGISRFPFTGTINKLTFNLAP